MILGLELNGRQRRRYRKVRAARLAGPNSLVRAEASAEKDRRSVQAPPTTVPDDRRRSAVGCPIRGGRPARFYFLDVLQSVYPELDRPLSIRKAAAAAGISRNVAAKHVAALKAEGAWPYRTLRARASA